MKVIGRVSVLGGGHDGTVLRCEKVPETVPPITPVVNLLQRGIAPDRLLIPRPGQQIF